MKKLLLSAALLSLLTSCAGDEEPVCIENVWCCSYTCSTEQEVEDRGPDICDCAALDDLVPPEGTCSALDGACDWR